MSSPLFHDPAPQDNPQTGKIKQRFRPKGKKPPKKITPAYLRNAGLAYLERFPTSIPHFRAVMMRRIKTSCDYHKDQEVSVCERLLEDVTADFIRQGYLNDSAYLKGMVHSYRSRGLSLQAIAHKLTTKGLKTTDIMAAITQEDADEGDNNDPHENGEWRAIITFMRKKRLGPFARVPSKDPKVKNRQLAALARAGFGADIAMRALRLDAGDLIKD